jgi:hypothetical protein
MEAGVLFESGDASSALPKQAAQRERLLEAERETQARRIAQLGEPT